jgi:hypothetical protein
MHTSCLRKMGQISPMNNPDWCNHKDERDITWYRRFLLSNIG